jgi:ribosomal protein S18 acetylase RimI-like enzyme
LERILRLHDRTAIEAVLRRDVYLHLYALGDLDPAFWPHTTWYGLADGDGVQAVILLYGATDPPTLLALSPPPADALAALLERVRPLLPPRMYAHVTPAALPALAAAYRVESRGPHLKMALVDPARLAVDPSAAAPLTAADEPELRTFYAASYPGAWFEPRMLAAGFIHGIRVDGALASVAGAHVFSPRYRVAAVGGIATHPAHRNRGLAAAVTASLCAALVPHVAHLGMNVRADNAPAVACYTRLGFRPAAEYEECLLTRAA